MEKIRNIFIIFIVSGFWHGANWTFIAWGTLNAIYFLSLMLPNKNRNNIEIVAQNRILPTLKELISIMITFGLTALVWIFFRAENIEHALLYFSGIFSFSLLTIPKGSDFISTGVSPIPMLYLLAFFNVIEWMGRAQPYAIASMGMGWPRLLRLYFTALLL